MGKSSKKQREKKADFAKQKLKVGKTAAKPHNYTDTNFSSRGVSVGQQSIVRNADLSYEQYEQAQLSTQVALLKHHGPTQRKEALSYIERYFEVHRKELEPTLSLLVKSVAPLVIDAEISVRNRLLEWLEITLGRLNASAVFPHAHVLMLYTISAMTHIMPDVRSDSTRFLYWLIKKCPSAAKSNSTKIIDGLAHLLSLKNRQNGGNFGGSAGQFHETRQRHMKTFANTLRIIFDSDDRPVSFEPPVFKWPCAVQIPNPQTYYLLNLKSDAYDRINVLGRNTSAPQDDSNKLLLIVQSWPSLPGFLDNEWYDTFSALSPEPNSGNKLAIEYGCVIIETLVILQNEIEQFQRESSEASQNDNKVKLFLGKWKESVSRVNKGIALFRQVNSYHQLNKAWKEFENLNTTLDLD